MIREEWCRRFKAEMIRVATAAAVTPPYGLTWPEYAEECAEPYYEDSSPLYTPEQDARAEVMLWEKGTDAK